MLSYRITITDIAENQVLLRKTENPQGKDKQLFIIFCIKPRLKIKLKITNVIFNNRYHIIDKIFKEKRFY